MGRKRNDFSIDLGLPKADIYVGDMFGSSKSRKSSSMISGIADLTSDISNLVGDTKRDYNITRQNVRQMRQDLQPVVAKARTVTTRGIAGIRKRIRNEEYYVLTINEGIVKKHRFRTEEKARAFRDLASGSGAYESVSYVARVPL